MASFALSATKIACVPCSRGKRRCDGANPCERCTRLGKPCFYDADPGSGLKKRRRSAYGTGLMYGGMGMNASARVAPVRTCDSHSSLPHVLFPWQGVQTTQDGAAGTMSTGPATILDGAAVVNPSVPSEPSTESHLRLLWSTTMSDRNFPQLRGGHGALNQASAASAGMDRTPAESVDGSEAHDEDDVNTDDVESPAPGNGAIKQNQSVSSSGRPKRARRGWAANRGYREYEEDDLYDDDDGARDGGASASYDDRLRASGAARDGDSQYAQLTSRSAASAGGLAGDGDDDAADDCAELSLRELLATESVNAEAHPAFAAAFQPGGDGARSVLSRVVANAAFLSTYGWSQQEIDLRVSAGHPLHWVHPADVLPRSAQAAIALRDQLGLYSCAGFRYLRRRVPQRADGPATMALSRAVRVLSAAIASHRASGPAGGAGEPGCSGDDRAAGATNGGSGTARVRSESGESASSMSMAAALASLGTPSIEPSGGAGTAIPQLQRGGEGAASTTSTSSSRRSAGASAAAAPDADEVAEALEDLDDCVEYTVAQGVREDVTQQFVAVSGGHSDGAGSSAGSRSLHVMIVRLVDSPP